VAEDGSRTPLRASGVRVPLKSGCWVAVDLHDEQQGGFAVDVAVRADRRRFDRLPRLAIVPHAGSSASVLIGSKGPGERSIDVVPVDDAELDGDIQHWLANTTSGDPIGEVVLARPDRRTIPARKFVVEYGEISAVHVSIRESTEALLVVEVGVRDMQTGARDVPFPCLVMFVHLHGANLVSFRFEELVGRVVE